MAKERRATITGSGVVERVLIVGLGSAGNRHARIARQLMPKAAITVLRHRRCDEIPAGIDDCVTTIEDAMRSRPQAAVIANPAPFHLEVSRRLADAGVHLLIEKPIADALPGISELIALCRGRCVVLMTGYNLRFLPSLRRLRELVRDGRVGQPLSVRAEVGQYLPAWRPEGDYRGGVSGKASLGGGVLLELSHEIDYLRWMLGDARWVSAIARKTSNLEIDVEDVAHLTIGFGNPGSEGEVIASLTMDFIRRDTTRTCTVIGESGTLRWDGIRGTVDVFEGQGEGWKTLFSEAPEPDASYVSELRHFFDCVAEGSAPEISGMDGEEAVRIVDAARRASASGVVVQITRGAAAAASSR